VLTRDGDRLGYLQYCDCELAQRKKHLKGVVRQCRFKGEESELPNPVAVHAAYSCWIAITLVVRCSNTGTDLMPSSRAGR
jgi:hypothetical protein